MKIHRNFPSIYTTKITETTLNETVDSITRLEVVAIYLTSAIIHRLGDCTAYELSNQKEREKV